MRAPAPDITPLSDWAAATDADGRIYLNATAVALEGQAALILGAPGRGKSALALGLIAHGARLIADDGLWASVLDGQIRLQRPADAPQLIESRGIGLLPSGPVVAEAPLALAIDLDHSETERLPPRRKVAMARVTRPLIRAAGLPHSTAAILHILRHGPPAV